MNHYIDDPIMCTECGYLHRHHAVSCERQRMTSEVKCWRCRGDGYFWRVPNGFNPFSAGGDSGSLIVTNGTQQPTGLLFAGSTTHTIANPIQAVLAALGVTIVT